MTMDVIRILIAILLPPLGVFLQVGIGLHFWLNILLTLLGYIPGIIHAIWVIQTRAPGTRPKASRSRASMVATPAIACRVYTLRSIQSSGVP